MPQVKMKYGIDLGTTNSTICCMENGEPVVKKTDTLKDTLPSCVSFTRRKVVKVGDGAYNDLRMDKARATKSWSDEKENVFIEFKRTMGLDTAYESSNMGRSYSSEELSAEVLKALRSFVSNDSVTAAVITVPAKFKTDQIAATKRAAELAGITQSELLQEPIAAAMAYGLNAGRKDARLVVFDFGGGTFDAALLGMEDGIMRVKDTEGDNYLGGKNLDFAIVDRILIEKLREEFSIEDILEDEDKREILRNSLKFYAEQAKNTLSFKDRADVTSQLDEFGEDDDGDPIELDLVITRDDLVPVLTPVFQKAIDITLGLLERNHLSGSDIDSLILVGGPTHSPILRDMLRRQVTPNVDTSIDPMTAVARGAALYASGIDAQADVPLQSGTLALDLSYESNTVDETTFISLKTLPGESTGSVPSEVQVEVTRGDRAWSSGKVRIDEVGDIIECHLASGRSNAFTITAYDARGTAVPCFPNEFSIMQGMVVGNAVLPYHIGLEAHSDETDKDIFVPMKGLEKNKSIPATGVRNGLKVPHALHPGVRKDRLVIPIYQGEHNAEGSSAVYNDHVFDVVITGEDVPELIPENSDVDITIKVDASQMMRLEAFFPVIGESVEKAVEIGQRSGVSDEELGRGLDAAHEKIADLDGNDAVPADELQDVQNALDEIDDRYDGESASEDGRMHLLADIRRAMLQMEEIERRHEWETLELKLKAELEKLESANNDLGNRFDDEIAGVKRQCTQVVRQKNAAAARETLKEISKLFFRVTFIYQIKGFIRSCHQDFSQYKWTDPARARALASKGMQLLREDAGVRELQSVVAGIIECMAKESSDKIRL